MTGGGPLTALDPLTQEVLLDKRTMATAPLASPRLGAVTLIRISIRGKGKPGFSSEKCKHYSILLALK